MTLGDSATSEGRIGLRQKLGFFRRGDSAKNSIAMRETAKTLDDVAMALGIDDGVVRALQQFAGSAVTQPGEKGDAKILVG